jgi:hypothetical protein
MTAELIARLEAATAPDRELDADIWETLGNRARGATTRRVFDATPKFTASIDAAVTLVPKGWILLGLNQRTKQEIGEANSSSCDPTEAMEWMAAVRLDTEDKAYRLPASKLRHSAATTAPLALCIAALKARENTR